MIDWRSVVNVFKVCDAGFGTGKVLNQSSTSMTSALVELAKASGAVGSAELAVPVNERLTQYPGGSGLVCETT